MVTVDVTALADAVRETGVGLKPGEVLAVRLPSDIAGDELNSAAAYGRMIERDTGIKVAFIPGEEFAHTTVNVTVNGTDPRRSPARFGGQVLERAPTGPPTSA